MAAELRKRQLHTLFAALFAAWLLASASAFADPPSRVGRVSFVQGDISFFQDRSEGWRPAQLNFPVTSENSFWAENGGRAEVRIGASALRIDEKSVLDIVRLQDNQQEAFLQRGSLNLRLRNDDSQNGGDRYSASDIFTVVTNEGRLVFNANGSYRVDAVPERAETRVTVFFGRARFENRDNRISVEAGKSLTVRGPVDAADFRFEPALESAFDQWAQSRDLNWDQAHTRYVRERVVSPYMTGYEDLDEYGDWIDDRDYGRLWTPRAVLREWAPYRYGHWAHVQPWGWTWIDDAAWGFAPFHYGRWVYVSTHERWAWWPGPYRHHPVYAPALVAWFNRPGVGFSIGAGPSVGWFPLAPRELYLPHYPTNASYIRNINYITNNVTVINPPTQYANQLPGATIVQDNVFHRGQPVGGNFARVPPSVIVAQAPGSGVDFGPRFTPRVGATLPPDSRGGARRPLPTFAVPGVPSSPVPPILPAPVVQNSDAGFALEPRQNKPIPVAGAGGALAVKSTQQPLPPPRARSQPSPGQAMPSIESRPIPSANSAPAASVDDAQRSNRQRRHERPVSERLPAPPIPQAQIHTQRHAGEQRVVAQPVVKPERDGKPLPAKQPRLEGHSKPQEVAR